MLPIKNSCISVNMRQTLLILSIIGLAAIGEAGESKKRVCVVGAGAGGLIAAHFLAAQSEEFDFVVFEKNSDVGGLWIYSDSTTVDEHGLPVHSSLYRDMWTNVPKELISYPDFTEIQGGNSSFVKHPTMLEYLKNYTDHFSLRQYIKFNTNVEKVSPLPEHRWLVRIRNLNTKHLNETSCDAVIIANGHYVKGNMPTIPGIETFPGRVIHSHYYRKPEEFTGQTVVLLGAERSGVDISIQISRVAKKVYLSSRHEKLTAELPSNLEQVLGVVGAKGNKLILSDNSTIEADALIFCTGYFFDFPFLDMTSGIHIVGGKYIRSLYKHLINIEHPTMAILTVPGFHFGISYAQVPYFLATLRGNVTLPPRREMLKDSMPAPGVSINKFHELPPRQLLSYYNELATAGGGQPIPPSREAGLYTFLSQPRKDPLHYREKNLYLYADGHAEFV